MIPDNVAVMLVESGRVLPRVIVASPCRPDILLMVATVVFDDDHVTVVVRFLILASVNIPVAVNCWVVMPVAREIVAVAGLTRIDASTGGVMESVALLDVTPDRLAAITVFPWATEAARPLEPVALLTVATPVSEECHVAKEVMSGALPSE